MRAEKPILDADKGAAGGGLLDSTNSASRKSTSDMQITAAPGDR